LWKRLVGSKVYEASLADDFNNTLRAYGFGADAPSPFAKFYENAENCRCIVVVNLDEENARTMTVDSDTTILNSYTIANGGRRLSSIDVMINGIEMAQTVEEGGEDLSVDLDTLLGVENGGNGQGDEVQLPPLTVTFVVVENK